MVIEDVCQSINFGCKIGVVTKAKENDTGMRMSEAEYKLAEIPVVGNQYSPFALSNSEHVWIRQPSRVITTNARGIMAELLQERNKTSVGALVEQKPHT